MRSNPLRCHVGLLIRSAKLMWKHEQPSTGHACCLLSLRGVRKRKVVSSQCHVYTCRCTLINDCCLRQWSLIITAVDTIPTIS